MVPDKTSRLFLLTSSGGLGSRMRMAFMESFKFSLVANCEITVKIFLAALYKSSPAEVRGFFSETAPLEKLLQELSSVDVSIHEITPLNSGGFTTGVSNSVDVKLVDLLIQAAEVKGGAEITGFMQVLSNDAQTVAFLRHDLGLNFKSVPPAPD